MCVILIGRITKEQHDLALKQNGDGFSLFTREQGLIKKPNAQQVKDGIGKFGIWHYRIATSGKIDTTNIHPFPICGGKYLLYHNGVLGDGLGDLSDTHALANTLMEVTIDTARTVITAVAARSRFVIASADDPTDFELFGDWEADAGILMSHKLYKPSVYPAGSYYGGAYYGGARTVTPTTTASGRKKDKKRVPNITNYKEEDDNGGWW